jgi:hypothetical protein
MRLGEEIKMDNEPQESGYEKLWGWFGLSYASWLTLPRVLMHAMPDEWQGKMAELLDEWTETFQNPPELGTRVQVTKHGKLVETPMWLKNYRHPDRDMINQVMGETAPEGGPKCNQTSPERSDT